MAFVFAFICIIFIDQAIKFGIITNLTLGETISFIPGIISITREHNTGVAFSIMEGVSNYILSAVSVIIVIVIIVLMAKNVIKGKGERWALIFVIAGAISNVLDRLVSKYVVDMFEFEFITFGIFNVADICIVCGIIVFAILWIRRDGRESRKSRQIKEERARNRDFDRDERPRRRTEESDIQRRPRHRTTEVERNSRHQASESDKVDEYFRDIERHIQEEYRDNSDYK